MQAFWPHISHVAATIIDICDFYVYNRNRELSSTPKSLEHNRSSYICIMLIFVLINHATLPKFVEYMRKEIFVPRVIFQAASLYKFTG